MAAKIEFSKNYKKISFADISEISPKRVSMATRVTFNYSQNLEFIRFTQNPVVTLSDKFAHNLELVTSGADKINQPN